LLLVVHGEELLEFFENVFKAALLLLLLSFAGAASTSSELAPKSVTKGIEASETTCSKGPCSSTS
jgi:hypothetical protein